MIRVPTDYGTIQAAINHANKEDTVFVYNGTYYEQVVVNKSISLRGEDRRGTIVDGNSTGVVTTITASHVNFTEFKVRFGSTGIGVKYANDFVRIENCILEHTGYGININGGASV